MPSLHPFTFLMLFKSTIQGTSTRWVTWYICSPCGGSQDPPCCRSDQCASHSELRSELNSASMALKPNKRPFEMPPKPTMRKWPCNASPIDPQPGESVVVTGIERTCTVSLPTIPHRQRIIKGEYVEFHQLLPESMFPTRYNNTPPSFTLDQGSDPSL